MELFLVIAAFVWGIWFGVLLARPAKKQKFWVYIGDRLHDIDY